jgi:hypothetical protein
MSNTIEEPDFLFGAQEIAEFVSGLTGRSLTRKQIYAWIDAGRLPAGKNGERALIASKRTIRAALSKSAGAAA